MSEADEFSTIRGEGGGEFQTADLALAISTGGPFQFFPLPESGEVTIGRSSSADVRVDDPSVSRKHAALRFTGRLYIRDLGSSNGVWLNGARVEPNAWIPLGVGEMAQVGAAMLVVRPRASQGRPRRIWSHGYFEGRIEEECARARRAGGKFGVVRLGLPRELPPREVEETLASWLRVVDVLARYAPHEYEVLFVDQDRASVDAALERLRMEIARSLGCEPGDIRAGTACFPDDEQEPDQLLSLANARVSGRPTTSPEMSGPLMSPALHDTIERIADSTMNVLILGETGVGKEICAEALHGRSSRACQKLLRLSCAALTESLLESELFGYEKGSFTGAGRAKPGLFETANGGTVFLDEIGELPLTIQVKLLRVLEERKVQRIGALEPKPIDVRFIAATNRDLDSQVAKGRFRQDLLFRINTYTLHIPPLRERVSEIESLARQFAVDAARDNGRDRAPAIGPEAMSLLRAYSWPGNVRELRNVIERAVVLSAGAAIDPSHLPLDKMSATVLSAPPAPPPSVFDEDDPTSSLRPVPRDTLDLPARPTQPIPLKSDVDALERQRILDALDETAGNQTRAARMLGISRGTLIARLDRYGIPRPRKR